MWRSYLFELAALSCQNPPQAAPEPGKTHIPGSFGDLSLIINLVHLRTLLPLVASVKIWPVCNLCDLHYKSSLMVWLIVHLEVFNSSDMRLLDLVGSSSIISCTLAMKSASLVFLASSFNFLLRSNTAETSLVSFRAFLMSEIVFLRSPRPWRWLHC